MQFPNCSAHAQRISNGHNTRGRNNRLIEAPATFILCRRICSARVPTFPPLCNLIAAPSAPVIQHRCNRRDPRVTTSPPPPPIHRQSARGVNLTRNKTTAIKKEGGGVERERNRKKRTRETRGRSSKRLRDSVEFCPPFVNKGRRTGIKSTGVDTAILELLVSRVRFGRTRVQRDVYCTYVLLRIAGFRKEKCFDYVQVWFGRRTN